MTERTPRRDFLLGHSAAGREAEPGDNSAREAATVGQDPDLRLNEPYLVHLSRKAMAGEFEICLPIAIAGEATAAALEALDLVQSLEAQLSFFKPDSDISEINREAADAAVEVEPRLFALLQSAMQLWRDSGGAYDVTAAPLWEAWGFARRAGAIPSPEQLAEARTLVGGQWVELDEAQKTIRLLRRGVRLNLGSIGKGYAVDRAVEHLLAAGVSDFLVHGSYSSVAARGSAPLPSPDQPAVGARKGRAPCTHGRGEGESGSPRRPWKIGVKDPLRDQRRLGQVELHDRALGTSGSQ
ncbi:MAG: FAD:protein FMN transferase, partial [Thermoguttaceae bacterium]